MSRRPSRIPRANPRTYRAPCTPDLDALHLHEGIEPTEGYDSEFEREDPCAPPAPFDPNNPAHIYNPRFGIRNIPEVGEPVTGFSSGLPFGRHGLGVESWGQGMCTNDFYTDAQLQTDDPARDAGMYFQGHIPFYAPPASQFDEYVDIGRGVATMTERVLRRRPGITLPKFPLNRTPVWTDSSCGRPLSILTFPGEPGHGPPINRLVDESEVERDPPIIYTPTCNPETPDPSLPVTGLGGPFSDNLDLPYGPSSYISPHFYEDACDSGPDPGMRFEAAIPAMEPSDDDFAKYILTQNRLLETATSMEQAIGRTFGRSHPFWRGATAPRWSATGKYRGPPCGRYAR